MGQLVAKGLVRLIVVDHTGHYMQTGFARQTHWMSAAAATLAQMQSRAAGQPFSAEVSRLLLERGLTQRALAAQIGVSPSHLSRVIRGVDYKTPSMDLMRKVASALGLADDYFTEYRVALILERLQRDAAFRERTYRSLKR